MYNPGGQLTPNQVGYNWVENSTTFQPSHNLPDAQAQSKITQVMNEITEHSGIKDKNMMLIYGYVCMAIGLLIVMGGGLAGIGLYMLSPIVGIILMIASFLIGAPFLVVGMALAMMFRKSFQDKKQKKVIGYVTDNMNRFR